MGENQTMAVKIRPMRGFHALHWWIYRRSILPTEDHLLVALKSYFDGSNHADSSEYDRISIASVCGMREAVEKI